MPEFPPVEVVVQPAGLSAALRAPAGRPRGDICRELCAALLDAEGVAPGLIDWDEVEAFVNACRAAAPDDAPERVVAEGTPPTHGEPGVVVIDEPTDDESNFDDRKNRIFRVVRAGQRLGTITDPGAGEDGVNVRGTSIHAKRGPAAPLRLHPSIVREGDALVAASGGVLHVGETLARILDVAEVPEFVDNSTGDLDLPCSVQVLQGVRDDFEVRVTGTATVRGLVEAAKIHAGWDARLDGGMAARGKGWLTVGRDLSARYLDQVHGEVMRDARIEREMVNCSLAVGRNLHCARGQIIGGEIAVAGMCEVDTVGSEAGVATRLSVGRSTRIESLLKRAQALRDSIGARLEKAEREHTQLTSLSGPKLTASQAERSTELEYELSTLRGMLSKVDTACRALLGIVRAGAVGQLTVNGRIHPKVTLQVGAYTASFRRELRGPVRIGIDDHGRAIVTNLLDESVVRLKEVALVEHDSGAVTLLDAA
ncbi:MAG: FapA family protein [Phycisphaerales bacterium]